MIGLLRWSIAPRLVCLNASIHSKDFIRGSEKSEPDDTYRSDNSGLREAGRDLDERRRHPVKEFFDENHLEDGVRVIKTLGPDGAAADSKATFKQNDLRRVAADLSDDRRKVAAVEGEIRQAFEEGESTIKLVLMKNTSSMRRWLNSPPT